MRVLVTRRLPASALARLRASCEVELPEGETFERGELLRRLRDASALVSVVTDRVDRELLDAAAGLRLVANVAVGYDNIDVAAACERGVIVTNTPDVLTDAVADLTWGLILAVTRRIVEGDRLVRRGGWKGWALDFMLGAGLRGKRLGIVGRGRIGRAVAARAPAFGVEAVFAARRTLSTSGRAEDLPALSIDELLVSSDILSLHVPQNAATVHLLDRRALVRMKRSAVLINTSRGPVVDEEALSWALGEGIIAGAGLDVYEREPEVFPGLLALENVVVAPHLGSATRETRTAMAELAADNVVAVLSGRPPLTPVTP